MGANSARGVNPRSGNETCCERVEFVDEVFISLLSMVGIVEEDDVSF
jgi:hypothetical protein